MLAASSIGSQPDAIVIGAGTVGSVLAARLISGDAPLRTLLLDSGAWGRNEHVQTPPLAMVTVPPPTVSWPGVALPPVTDVDCWRIPWRSPLPFQGLAYGVGGRSRFWGAYCVWPDLTGIGGTRAWPASVAKALDERYLPEAAELLGLGVAHSHLNGLLNTYLRERLKQGLTHGHVGSLRPMQCWPTSPHIFRRSEDVDPRLEGSAGLEDLRLNLPMAVRITEVRGGVNIVRFSAASHLLRAAETDGSHLDVRPGCHVVGLHIQGTCVRAVYTTLGRIDVPAGVPVVLAAGTIESARMVLNATGSENHRRAGTGFSAHMRSNLTVRLSFPHRLAGAVPPGAAALAVRGVAGPDGPGFHHQITAFAVGDIDPSSAQDLYLSTPRRDVESLAMGHRTPPRHLVITVASVGAMATPSPGRISLADETDEHGSRYAQVYFDVGEADLRAWSAMDQSADELLACLTDGEEVEVLRSGRFEPAAGRPLHQVVGHEERREPIGCGHHEMGSLPIGATDGPGTNTDGLAHGFDNLFIAGPAVFPSLDSAGPVLPSIAVTLRLADFLKRAADCPSPAEHR